MPTSCRIHTDLNQYELRQPKLTRCAYHRHPGLYSYELYNIASGKSRNRAIKRQKEKIGGPCPSPSGGIRRDITIQGPVFRYKSGSRPENEANGPESSKKATGRNRTGNLRFTKPLLCQLSYGGLISQQRDLNSRPVLYERTALPLSYAGGRGIVNTPTGTGKAGERGRGFGVWAWGPDTTPVTKPAQPWPRSLPLNSYTTRTPSPSRTAA